MSLGGLGRSLGGLWEVSGRSLGGWGGQGAQRQPKLNLLIHVSARMHELHLFVNFMKCF